VECCSYAAGTAEKPRNLGRMDAWDAHAGRVALLRADDVRGLVHAWQASIEEAGGAVGTGTLVGSLLNMER